MNSEVLSTPVVNTGIAVTEIISEGGLLKLDEFLEHTKVRKSSVLKIIQRPFRKVAITSNSHLLQVTV